ncbi:MAG: porin [Prochlorococcus marinus CUG1432]|nr:porin [Prochlorococcus marinus CUG1432]
MKLFQRLLVAPAALGLLTPLSATATEVNLNEISNYSDVESVEFVNSFDDNSSNQTTLIAGGEGLVDSFDGGFSQTTTATFGANFYAGVIYDDDNPAAGANDGDDNLGTGYDFGIDLTTSFTGEDALVVEIDAGSSGAPGIAEFDTDNTTNEALTVDEIYYTFPLGDKTTVMVGDNKDASSLFTTSCVYGGPTDTLDACGNVNAAVDNGGVMLGASYDFGNGLTAAVGYAGNENDVANEEGIDAYGANVAYTGDNFGLSFTYGALEDGAAAPQDNMGTDTFYALNAYFTPDSEGLPSISVGYELGEDESVVGDADGLTNFFAGLQWDEVGPGSLGIAMGTRVNTVEDTDAQYMYEAWYSYPINDGMTITPVIFTQDISAVNTDDTTGVMVRTSFSF